MASKFNDKQYMSICSERTLQSNSKGFFLTFADNIADLVGPDWIKKTFGKLSSDEERIKTIYKHSPIKEALMEVFGNVQEIYRKKSAQISKEKCMEANEALRKNNSKKAMLLYSQSILRSPQTEDILWIALHGRAQALVQLKEYELALRDIQLALKENLPFTFKGEAYRIMAICYKGLQDEKKANVAFSLAEKLLTTEDNKIQLEKDKSCNYQKVTSTNRRVKPKLETEPHKAYPSATNKLSVKQSDKFGRFVVANKPINTGETIVVESPYAACLLPEMFGTHCHHCFDRLVVPFGCNTCSSVAFCSVECKDEALNTYHKYECKYLDLLIGSGMSILGHTALKMITQFDLEKVLSFYKDRSKFNVYNLCTNSNLRPASDFLQRTLMAAFLLRCLQKSGYFGELENRVIPTKDEFCIGELLLYHLQMLQFNAHEIYETVHPPNHRFRESKASYIGVAVYPTVALFNHDCYPAVTRYFVGKKIVIKAVHPLNSNEMISENYGPIFTRRTIQERQRSLSSRYWFNCQCLACIHNWPSLNTGLDGISKRIRCLNKKCDYLFTLPLTNQIITCPKCNNKGDLSERVKLLLWCENQYSLGFDAMDLENPEKGISILCKAIDTFYRISSAPHKTTHLAQETLRACLADSGNVYVK